MRILGCGCVCVCVGSSAADIQILSEKGGQAGYEQALRRQRAGACANATRKAAVNKPPTGFKQIRGKDGRGLAPVSKRAGDNTRRMIASKGGARKAGGVSSEKIVQQKTRCMQRYWQKHGAFPSKRLSAERWSVSTKLWNRVRQATVA